MGINFYDYVSCYDFVPFAQLLENDDFKVISTTKTNLISSHIKKEYATISDVKIEFKPETVKKEKTTLRFKLQRAHMYASDPDGYLRYKLTTVERQVFVSNHNKKDVEHDLGVKKYGDVIEIVFSKNLMETVQFIDFYFKDNCDHWLDLKGTLPDKWDHCGRVSIGEASTCYCLEMGLVNKSCFGEGEKISDTDYKNLASELETESAAIYAVAKRESSGKNFTIHNKKQVAKILYERHYMYRLLSSKNGELFAKKKMEMKPYLVNSSSGRYVYNSEGIKETNEEIASLEKLDKAKEIDEDCAIQSCSWGAFQVMGEYYHHSYKSPKDLEKAMNMCEKQQLSYFKTYLLKVKIKAHKALKEKDWEMFTYWYNGSNWKANNSTYPTDMAKYYEKFKEKK